MYLIISEVQGCLTSSVSILWLPTALFGKSICYLSVELYVWKNDTATSGKVSIPAGFCKSKCCWSESSSNKALVSIIFCIQTRKCMKHFMENITEYFVHNQTARTRPLLGASTHVQVCHQNPLFTCPIDIPPSLTRLVPLCNRYPWDVYWTSHPH